MKQNTVSVAFTFDDAFALPAWVSVRSMLSSAKPTTFYDIYIVYSRLSAENIRIFSDFSGKRCRVHFILIDNTRFKDAAFSESWPYEVYYRLILPDVLPDSVDKVIYSDVDVMFRGDLSALYAEDLSAYQAAAVPAERRGEKNGIHQHFEAYLHPYVYMSGFMVMNLKRMRREKTVSTFFKMMRRYKERLKMFDLEVFNLSCDRIKPVSFSYCVLENLYYAKNFRNAPEYVFLKNVYTDADLSAAVSTPVIIHYAGAKVKMWRKINPDPFYRSYILSSPYAEKYLSDIRLKKILRFFMPALFLLSRIVPSAKARKKLRTLYKGSF